MLKPYPKFLFALAVLASSLPVTAQPGSAARRDDTPAIPNADDAPIAFMVDMTSGQILYAREADRRFMPASMTKVMTTFLAFEWMAAGKLTPNQLFTVRPETFRKWSGVGSTMFVPSGAQISVDDLLHGVTTVSANDGAVVLAEGAAGSVDKWTAAMNAKAREIGMRNSHYGTPNGWMDEGRTFVTARDLVTLGSAMIARHPVQYHHYVGASGFQFNGIAQQNHDPISGVVPGADGIKTGFTNQAGYGFLGSAERNGRRLVMVVAACPTGKARNRAARSFIEWGFTAFSSRHLFPVDARIADAQVQGGATSSVGLRARGPVEVSVPRGTNPRISLTVDYQGPLQAPIQKGEEVAELVVHVEGMAEGRVPLVATSDVGEANAIQRLFNGLRGLFS